MLLLLLHLITLRRTMIFSKWSPSNVCYFECYHARKQVRAYIATKKIYDPNNHWLLRTVTWPCYTMNDTFASEAKLTMAIVLPRTIFEYGTYIWDFPNLWNLVVANQVNSCSPVCCAHFSRIPTISVIFCFCCIIGK